jgi:hypothetical protein
MVAVADILALIEGDSLILVGCKSGTCEWKMSLDRTSLQRTVQMQMRQRESDTDK